VQPEGRTVQGTVREALRPLLGEQVRVVGASRTDAGVHAIGQVASVSGGRALAPAPVMAALNATLPRDIRVRGVRAVAPGFDARRAARLKRYVYLLATDPVPWPFLRGYTWNPGRRLSVAAMRAAAGALRGRHDFSAFRAAAGRSRSPVCRVHSLRVVERRGLLAVFVSADAFLHHMVRNMVGTLAEVGAGRRPVRWASEVLAARDRSRAGPTAPASGLFLVSVRYATPLFPGGGRGGGGVSRPP
jgi:tRNA pseudouridine38-40 synthase